MKAEKKVLFAPGTVEVFKTNVGNQRTANHLKLLLERLLPACKINFDLEDCDNILRIKGDNINKEKIIKLMTHYNYFCEPLVD